MATRFRSTSRGLLLAGALAFLAVPAFAQSAPATQPAPAAAVTGKPATDAGKTVSTDGKKAADKTTKSKTHKVVAKKGSDGKSEKPATPAAPAADSAKKS